MKKFAFLSFIALGLGLVSCDDFDYPNPPGQSNPQEPVLDAAVALQMEALTSSVDLETAYSANTLIDLATVVSTEGIDPEYVLSFKGEMSASADFAGAQEFDVIMIENDNTLKAAPAELGDIFRAAFNTIDPAPRTAYIRFKAYAGSEEAVSYRLGGLDAYFCPMTVSVTPLKPDFFVNQAYYLIYCDDAESWTAEKAVKFNHSDRSVYDDPSFSVMLNFTQAELGDGLYWKVIPAATYESFDLANGVVYGVPEKDAESRSGSLDPSVDQLAGYFDIDGAAEFTVNMRNFTFSFRQAIENFWIAGDGNGWSFSETPDLWTENYADYAGLVVLGSEFKFSPTNGWSGDFGMSDAFVYGDDNGEYIGTGSANGSTNINVGEPGFYYISLYYPNRYTKLVKIDSWGIIGGFNGWGESIVMNKVDDYTYTLTADLNAGDEWKFRANNNWTVSLGGSLDKLSPFNGSNLVCAESGTYDITLNLKQLPWTATVVKK